MDRFRATIRVRYGETDQMGVVYHANYLNWFEVGRTEFFRSLGMNYRKLEDKGVLLPVIDINCQYIQAARYDDVVYIYPKITFLKGVKLRYQYEIVREDGTLLATGETLHTFVDKDFKPVNLKKALPEVWDLLQQRVEGEE